MGDLRDWKQTALWRILESRMDSHAEECRTALRSLMPDIQDILVAGGTSQKDFTLHDAGHSFRVAERIVEVAGQTIEILSCFEITLLLLAAYLHDIGMTPRFDLVRRHYDYLLSGEPSLLSSAEVSSLQKWLDDSGRQLVPPIPKDLAELDRIKIAREATTHYCREQHNDWSAEWMKTNLANQRLGSYVGWVEDLVLLCQSHHFGWDRLIHSSFRIRRVGNPSDVVNLRYLAMLLRVSDILDFDPERTPEIVLRHREISPDSQIYWWRDRGISITVAGGKVGITARPSLARIHRAIEEAADGIDNELALCRRIADDFPLGAIPGEDALPYTWSLSTSCHRDIEPRESTYEYIDGAFRPDTEKLLALLSGSALYQTPLHAVRELIQNAFDAVAERIAYIRLSSPNPSSVELGHQLATRHRVALHHHSDGEDSFLTCTDNGIGMTKAIIRDRVLVSGSSARHDVRALDRRCESAGFELGRSGKFGIGVLSYFMIASQVEIETARAQEANDSESVRWYFTTEGVGTFGELRKTAGSNPGTEIRLRLNRDVASNTIEWYNRLRDYLERTLVYCPCEFTLTSSFPQCPPLELKPGWSPRDHSIECVRPLRKSRDASYEEKLKLLSKTELAKRATAELETAEVEAELRKSLEWQSVEGITSDKSARYFISIPYFIIEGGASLAFLRARRNPAGKIEIQSFAGGVLLRPAGETEEAWKGMAVVPRHGWQGLRLRRFDIPHCFVRINWISDRAGEVMANREEFHPGDLTIAEKEIATRFRSVLTQFLEDNKKSEFAWLNERLARVQRPKSNCLWLRLGPCKGKESTTFVWDKPAFPVVSRASFGYIGPNEGSELQIGDKMLQVLPLAAGPSNDGKFKDHDGIGWNTSGMSPDRIAGQGLWPYGLAPIWFGLSGERRKADRLESRFPPALSNVCGAFFEWYAGNGNPATVWNSEHPIVKLVNEPAWCWCRTVFGKSIDPVPHRHELLENLEKGAAWLLKCVESDNSEIWDGLRDRDPEFLPSLFGQISKKKKKAFKNGTIDFWVQDSNPRLRVVSEFIWRTEPERDLRDKLAPDGEAWVVKIARDHPLHEAKRLRRARK